MLFKKSAVPGALFCLLTVLSFFCAFAVQAAVPAKPSAPSVNSFYQPIRTNVSISWGAVSGATSYKFYENGSVIYSGSSRSMSRSHSTYGRRLYTVAACNSSGCGSVSSAIPIFYYTAPGGVNNLSASSSSVKVGSNVSFSWTGAGGSVPGVFYKVYLNGSYKGTVSSMGYSTSISSAGANTFKVNACNPNNVGCGGSRSVSVTGTMDPPGKASAASVNSYYQPVNSNVSISWGAVANATSYKLYEDGSVIYNSSGRSTTRKHSAYGRRLYTVAACNAGGCGSVSSAIPIFYYTAPGGVNNLSASSSSVKVGSNVSFSWTGAGGSVPGVFYKVYLNGSYKGTVSSMRYSTTISSVGTNTLRVNACNPSNAGCGGSRSVSVTGTMDPPGKASPIIMASLYHPVNTNVAIGWPAVSNATSYKLYEDGAVIYNSSGRSTTRKHSAYGRRLYTVAACNAGGCGSPSSVMPIVYYTVPGPVVNLAASASSALVGSSVQLSWGAGGGSVPGVTFRVNVNGVFQQEITANSTNITLSKAGNNTLSVNECNPKTVGCSSTRTVNVQGTLPVPGKPAAPSIANLYQPINAPVPVQWPANNSTVTHKLFYTIGLPITASSATIYANGVDTTATPAPSFANYGYAWYFSQACNTLDQCSDNSPFIRTALFTTPGYVNNLTAPATIAPNTPFTLNWTAAGGSIPAATYRVTLNNKEVYNQSPKTFTTNQATPGSYTYYVQACNPGFSCGGAKPVTVVVNGDTTVPIVASFTSNKSQINQGESIKLSWTKPANTTQTLTYNLSVEKPDGSPRYTFANNISALSFDRLINMPGEHQFFVQACDSKDVCGETKSLVVNVSGDSTTPGNPETPPAVSLAALPTDADAQSEVVGTIAGSFRVDESGAATYNVPLSIPQGIAGISPDVSVNYHSSSGNGIMGIGWSAGAGSTISRCRQTVETDGISTAISLTNADRFCLDGQRLVAAPNEQGVEGSYGGADTQYRTLIDSQARVTSKGTSGHGPAYFTVERIDGSTSTYGNTSDSVMVDGNNTKVMWQLNSQKDHKNNEIVYSYLSSGTAVGENELLIDTITYSGNKIDFQYNLNDARTDTATRYMAGIKFEQKARLDAIVITNHNDVDINSYHFGYDTEVTGSTVLQDIIQCDGALTGSCLPATSFDWTDFNAAANTAARYTRFNADNLSTFRQLDFNADGISDLIYVSFKTNNGTQNGDIIPFTLHTLRGSGNSFSTSEVPASHTFNNTLYNSFALNTSVSIADVDNDGRQDVLLYHKRSNTDKGWTAFLSKENGQGVPYWQQKPLDPSIGLHSLVIADIDGDGRSDLMNGSVYDWSTSRHQLNYFTSSDDLFDTSAQITLNGGEAGILIPSYRPHIFGDFNGDGITDFVATVSDSIMVQYAVFISHQADDGTVSMDLLADTMMAASGDEIFVADINGDGLSDLIFNGTPMSDLSEIKWRYRLSNGRDFEPVTDMGLNTYPKSDFNSFQLGDINIDGWLDFVYYDSKNDQWQYIPFVDSAFEAVKTMTVPDGVRGELDLDSAIFADYNGNGYADLMYFDVADKRIVKYPDGNSEPKAKIEQINNGRNMITDIEYKPLTDNTVYRRNTGAEALNWGKGAAVFDVISATQVVASVSSSSPGFDADDNYQSLNQESVDYFYTGLRVQAGGRGNLGFASLQTTAGRTGIITTTTYRQDFPYVGLPLTTTQTVNEQTLSYAINTYPETVLMLNGERVYSPYIDSTTEQAYVVNSTTGNTELVSTSVTDNTYVAYDDNHAQLTNVSTTVTDHSNSNATASTTTVNHYSADNENITNWWLNRIEKTTVTHSRSDSFPAADITRVSAFEYDPTTGVLMRTEVEPNGNNQLFLGTLRCFDTVGNKIKTVTYSNHYTPECTTATPDTSDDPLKVFRVNQVTYDDAKRFIKTSGDHTFTAVTYNNRNGWGQSTQATDINGIVSDIRFDAFGSEYFRRSNVGGYAITTRRWTENSATIDAPAISESFDYVEKIQAAGKPTSYQYYDALGRNVAVVREGFAADAWLYQYTRYNLSSDVVAQSNPSYHQIADYWTVSDMDDYGRALSTSHADGKTSTVFSYNKTTISSTVSSDLNGYAVTQSQSETKNVHGDTVSIKDNNEKSITYQYNAAGALTTMTGVDGKKMVNTVDRMGRKTSSTDPDLGLWHYTYNALGELATQTDAKSQLSTFNRDNLGRTVKRTVATEVTNYLYGSSHLMQSEAIVGGMSRSFGYDSLGRSNHVTTTLEATPYYAHITYDQYGRVFQKFDASTTNSKTKGIRYHYNNRGYLTQEQEANEGTDGEVYFSITAMDALGNLTTFKQGGHHQTIRTYHPATGLIDSIVAGGQGAIQNWDHTHDGLGNLKVRQNLNGSSERFDYDNLNRLTDSYRTIGGIEVHNKALTYHDNGNIKSQSNGALGDSNSYLYNQTATQTQCSNTAGAHAVTSFGANRYCYDLNGNQITTKDKTSNQTTRAIQYSAFNKPIRIEANNKLTQFSYDSGHSRYKRVDSDSDGSNATTTYTIGNVEVVIHSDGSQEVRRYLGAYAIETSYTSGSNKVQYLHRNHLGSLDTITNETGQIITSLSFDAFGQRRETGSLNIIVQVHLAISLQDAYGITKRGFTGQEHIDSANLIHMNGRIYDPVLARFVQADPLVQAPKNTQSLNRYSYVINNPLAGTDPSGYVFLLSKPIRWVFSKLSNSAGQFVAAVASMYCGPAAPLCAAALSYENARAHGYNRGTAMQAGIHAGISAGMFQMIGSAYANTNMGCPSCYNTAGEMVSGFAGKTLSHAVAGGVMSTLQGGKFGHGFFAAGATEALAPQIGLIAQGQGGIYKGVRVMTAAVVGGSVSKLTGGKFSNGAVTGAYSRAFNSELHDEGSYTDEFEEPQYSKEPLLESTIEITIKNRAGVVTATDIFSGKKTKSVTLAELPGAPIAFTGSVDSNNRATYDIQLTKAITIDKTTITPSVALATDGKITSQIHVEYDNTGVAAKTAVNTKVVTQDWHTAVTKFSQTIQRCVSKGACGF